MRYRRRSSPAVPLCLLSLAAGVFAAAAAAESSPEASWIEIETWAQAGAPAAAAPPAPSAKPGPGKTTTPGPAKLTTPANVNAQDHAPRTEPLSAVQMRAKFLQRTAASLQRHENAKEWDHAAEDAYSMEQFDRALDYLARMLADPRRWQNRESDGWLNLHLWQTGIMITRKTDRAKLEQCFKDWKIKFQAYSAAQVNSEADEARANAIKARDERILKHHERLFQESPTLRDELDRLEQAAPSDPKALWELCERLNDERPYWPLKDLSALCRMREWYPSDPHVVSGEVQYRLARLLNDKLGLARECADEAAALIAMTPKYWGVTSGEALWLVADNKLKQARESANNKEALDLLKEAKADFEEFQQKYPKHWCNRRNDVGKTTCMYRLKDVSDEIRRRD